MEYALLLLLLILIAILFFIERLSARQVGNNKIQIFYGVLHTLFGLTILSIGLICLFVLPNSSTDYPRRNFNKQLWLKDTITKYEMADDIIKRKILIGKDSNSIVTLLGAGRKITGVVSDTTYWEYDIGFPPEYYIALDPTFLTIRFHKGIVDSVYPYNH